MKIDNYAVPVDSKAAKLLPQQQKLDWERQWLNENKNAFDVVESDRQSKPSVRHDFEFNGREKLPDELIAQQDAESGQSSKYFLSEVKGNTNKHAIGETRFVHIGNNVFSSGASMPLMNLREAGVVISLNADVKELHMRPELKQFAIWRDGKKAAATMRLPENLQEDGEIVTTLRQWLTDAGLKLVSLIVNGKIRWKL